MNLTPTLPVKQRREEWSTQKYKTKFKRKRTGNIPLIYDYNWSSWKSDGYI